VANLKGAAVLEASLLALVDMVARVPSIRTGPRV
jgi:hypothetical protein